MPDHIGPRGTRAMLRHVRCCARFPGTCYSSPGARGRPLAAAIPSQFRGRRTVSRGRDGFRLGQPLNLAARFDGTIMSRPGRRDGRRARRPVCHVRRPLARALAYQTVADVYVAIGRQPRTQQVGHIWAVTVLRPTSAMQRKHDASHVLLAVYARDPLTQVARCNEARLWVIT